MSNSSTNPGLPVPGLESSGDGAQSDHPGFKLVKYEYESTGRQTVLKELKAKTILPPVDCQNHKPD